jgi:hypothetical protein
MTDGCYEVAVVGVGHAVQRLEGVADVAVLDGCDLSAASFDESTHSWTLPTCRARVLITDQKRSGRDDLAPYLGVAVHGAPNYFIVTGAEAVANARLDYIVECLTVMRRSDCTRMEVLFSAQRMFCLREPETTDLAAPAFWERMSARIPTAFDLSSHASVVDEVYDGAATIRLRDDEHVVRVRLSGRLDPIDGRFHWQGTVLQGLPDRIPMQPVTVTIAGESAQGRITERTQQGGYAINGVGAPPYALDDVEVAVPSR